MIFYFSATGNSQYVAEQIAQETKDEMISINQCLKDHHTSAFLSTDKPLVFVSPVYAWRMPRIVENFIKKASFEGQHSVYFVLTYGGETAQAQKYVNNICRQKGWELKGYAEVKMPDTYLVLFPGVSKTAATEINQKAKLVISQIVQEIAQNNPIPFMTESGIKNQLKSSLINHIFYLLIVKSKGFYAVASKCIGCGKCMELCPLNNISLVDHKPIWGNSCTHCMSCLHRCPTEAIEYKNKSQGKPRYFFEQSHR